MKVQNKKIDFFCFFGVVVVTKFFWNKMKKKVGSISVREILFQLVKTVAILKNIIFLSLFVFLGFEREETNTDKNSRNMKTMNFRFDLNFL